MSNKLLTLTAATVMGALFASAVPAFAAEQQENAYYFKAGLGYNFSKIAIEQGKNSPKMKGPGAEIGFGYNFSKNVRADLSVRYMKDSSKKMDGSEFGIPNYKIKQDNLALLASVYYQFDTGTDFSPFLVAGLGVQSTKNKFQINKLNIGNATNPGTAGTVLTKENYALNAPVKEQVQSLSSKKKTAFLYKVGGGFSYQVDQCVFLDLEYNLSNRNNGKFVKTDGLYLTAVAPNGNAAAASQAMPDTSKYKMKQKLSHTVMFGVRIVM